MSGSSACPEDDALLQFVDGVDDGSTPAHVRTCNRCQVAVALVLQSSSIGGTTLPAEELTSDGLIAWIEEAQRRRASLLPQGTKIGRYEILRRAGAGGMGVVYLAHDPDLDRKVAVKLLHPDKSDDKRLLREARALAKVAHPNVVTVHDVGAVDEGVFVAMEFIEGQTLREWLRAERDIDRILEVFIEAGRGLLAAHAAGLVHRDFKPDNVLIGDDDRVRVTDFGLARDHDPVRSQITQMGAVVGTPWYMAPEVLSGSHADARSDQFSFAVTLYQALIGHRPRADLPLLESGALPARLRRVLQRALRTDPAARFESMAELVSELTACRSKRAPWRALAVALVAVAASLGLWALADRGREEARREETVPATQAPSDAAPLTPAAPPSQTAASPSPTPDAGAPPAPRPRVRPPEQQPSAAPSALPSSNPLDEF
jgi:serine/threonine protein kinase